MTLEPIEEVKPGNIQIPKELYEELLESQEILDALIGAGVDNWPGYDDAMALLNKK